MKLYEEIPAMPGLQSAEHLAGTIMPGHYEYSETLDMVQLVEDAAELVHLKGEGAFIDFAVPGSRWRQGEQYIFVLDMEGNMLVHPDPDLNGKNQLALRDINGKPIVRGLITVATARPAWHGGWYHYEWPVPGGLLPRWKSTYVKQVQTPAGRKYIVGSGMYNDRMERSCVVDLVMQGVAAVEKDADRAYKLFHDPTGPFIAKDAYIYVIDMNGVEVVNPAFPAVEGKLMIDQKDSSGKLFYRDMIAMIGAKGSGWIDYMWPKPGESVSTQKSAFVHAARKGDETVMVGCGVYLADAPVEIMPKATTSAMELASLVREAADILEKQGQQAFGEFRRKDSKWYHEDTYLFVFDMNGNRVFHAAEPQTEGNNDISLKDVMGRPIVSMILEAGSAPNGEGWVHYMYPEPGAVFPVWKSSFVKRVVFPSGTPYIVGCGIYRMQMDKAFIEDVVERAASLVAQKGKEAFPLLRDRKGPFVFMDTYVFIQTPEGTELVNPAQPSLEGKNLFELKDLKGKSFVRDEIAAAIKEGKAWLECYWYKPGDNRPVPKQTFVRRVSHDGETFIVGSGFYSDESGDTGKMTGTK
jgi:signal transduction histidine kinase